MNEIIAQIFEDIADMLEILGENVFRIRAYRRAAQVVLTADLESEGKLPGIGPDLSAKIKEIKETGTCEMHQRLVKRLTPGVLEILHVRGIGPKKVKLFLEQLDINTIDKLRAAAESGALATLPGMGEKSEEAIIEALKQKTHMKKRIPLATAEKEAKAYIKYMETCKGLKEISAAGSLRRRADTIGDIDLLATGKDAAVLSEHFHKYPKIKQVLAAGDTKSSVVIGKENIQVDFRVVDAESYGAALFYFTGPKHFNIKVRTIALKKNMKVNEYGLFEGEEKIAGETEEEMFKGLDLDYIGPEDRKDHT